MSQTNRNFAKLVDGKIQYAPRVFQEKSAVVVPGVDDANFYLAHGWLQVVDEQPEHDEAEKYAVRTGWEEDAESGKISAVYELRDLSSTPQIVEVKKLSKLKITLFCMQQGIWDKVKAYLEKIDYYDLFVMAQYFLENDEYFTKGVEQFKEAFREEIENVDELAEQMQAFAEDGYETVEVEAEATE